MRLRMKTGRMKNRRVKPACAVKAETETRHAAERIQAKPNLEQPRSTQSSYRIGHRQRLPLEKPASHRESQSREADVKDFHTSTP